MNTSLLFQIAKTHLLSRPKQTVVAALGVTFGISMFIFMVSFMTGVNKLLEETTLTNTPHIRIFNDIETDRPSILDEYYRNTPILTVVHHQKPKKEKQNLKDGFQIVRTIQADNRVLGISPLANSQVFYNYGSQQISGLITGVDIMAEDKLFNIRDKMIQGRIENLLSANNGIIMGAGLARKLNAQEGDKVSITTPEGVRLLLNIVGIMRTGIVQIDDTKSYATLATVQKILQEDNRYITDINIKLKDLNQAKGVAASYQSIFGYKAEDWETANATILLSFTLRNFITYAVVFTILTVAGFGIYNILNMTIYEKMKDIAILKATGFSGKDITSIFMVQAVTIGIAGGMVGLLLGFILSYAVSKVPFKADAFINMDHLPVNFDPYYYIVALLFGMLTTALSGYLPSRKASKIDPVEIIRGK
ncbi:ABC transporter permease [Rhodocytophaga aerolata]|uniref:ABC transporter permease n=1 Tax=Rhodocytophaga aerolata TaxID=455078 RepID=A0ABT8R1W6_9BACT|nr:ABC transporter permease [Rhodocytophaga aerolata]MDO1446090.1 ABC transporter permease [Rhodocytophaga aerolata]